MAMNTENTPKVCTNCKYFLRYYVIGVDCTFTPTALGHCINLKVSKGISTKRVNKNVGCDLWQPYELQKLSIQYGIEERLQFYCRKIEELLIALRDVE